MVSCVRGKNEQQRYTDIRQQPEIWRIFVVQIPGETWFDQSYAVLGWDIFSPVFGKLCVDFLEVERQVQLCR